MQQAGAKEGRKILENNSIGARDLKTGGWREFKFSPTQSSRAERNERAAFSRTTAAAVLTNAAIILPCFKLQGSFVPLLSDKDNNFIVSQLFLLYLQIFHSRLFSAVLRFKCR